MLFNSIQKTIDDKIEDLRGRGIPPRIIVLKARQEGVSTYAQGKIMCRAVKNKNINALVVAHREDSTAAIFEKSKFMYQRLPDDVKPLQKASNANELIFDRPTNYAGDGDGLNSRIKIQTAGGSGIGRSDTYNYVHLSEFAFYPGNALDQLQAIMQSVPNTVDSLVIIESTANGFNDFKELWDSAVAGKNDWTPMFFPWHVYEDYRMPATEPERIRIMDTLNDYEQEILNLYSLSAEQIKWYRWALANNCGGKADKMKQENPSYPKEAFLSTGRPVFDNTVVELRIEHLKKHYEQHPFRVGRFSFEWENPDTQDRIKSASIQFIEDANGWLKVYDEPINGHPYVIGGDTKGEGHDFYTATVRDNATGHRVATMRMQLTNSKPYSHQLYCLGMWYKQALIGVEMNFNTAPIEELERLNYPRQYMREIYDKMGVEFQKRHGWKTDGNTRPLLIDREIDIVEHNIELFYDIDTLDEMLTFAYDEKNRPDAMAGKHDDLLISDMIAQEIGGQMTTKVTDEPQPARQRLPEQLKIKRHRR